MDGRVVTRRRQLERFLLPRLGGAVWSHSLGERTSFNGHTLGTNYESGLQLEVRVKHLHALTLASLVLQHPTRTLRYYEHIELRSRRDLVRLCRLVDRTRAYAMGKLAPLTPKSAEKLTAELASEVAHQVYRAVLEAIYPKTPPVFHLTTQSRMKSPELWFGLRARRLDLDRHAFLAWANAGEERLADFGLEVVDARPDPVEFYRRFPQAPGLVSFSPVGFDPQLKRACVVLEHDTLLESFERGPLTDEAGRYRSVRRLLALTWRDGWQLDGWLEERPDEQEWREFEREYLAANLPEHVSLRQLDQDGLHPELARLEVTWNGKTREIVVVDPCALSNRVQCWPRVFAPGVPTVVAHPIDVGAVVEGIQALLDEV